jgi:hypothetical protein
MTSSPFSRIGIHGQQQNLMKQDDMHEKKLPLTHLSKVTFDHQHGIQKELPVEDTVSCAEQGQ